MNFRYAIGLGSNRPHGRYGAPATVLAAACHAMEAAGLCIISLSKVAQTKPMGPSHRRFANAAALVETCLTPPALLSLLKSIERSFGRRGGQRWGPRVLDLDILLWSEGRWVRRQLAIPHVGLTVRRFALDPLAAVAGDWRIGGGTRVRHHAARLTRPRPVHRSVAGRVRSSVGRASDF